MNYATSQIKTKSVSLINNVVNKHISNISDLNKLIIISTYILKHENKTRFKFLETMES